MEIPTVGNPQADRVWTPAQHEWLRSIKWTVMSTSAWPTGDKSGFMVFLPSATRAGWEIENIHAGAFGEVIASFDTLEAAVAYIAVEVSNRG